MSGPNDPSKDAAAEGAEGGEVETYPPEEHGSGDPADEAWGAHAHGKKKRRKRKPMPGENIGHLNLTPMMDIMTMLLVFLVMSFATEPNNINVNLTLRPPESTSKTILDAATKVTITTEMILVDDEEVLSLQQVKTSGPDQQLSIPAVKDALLERADHLKALESRGGSPFDGRLLIVAHETTPYSLLTSILVTAGESKFSEYKLVVMQKAD